MEAGVRHGRVPVDIVRINVDVHQVERNSGDR